MKRKHNSEDDDHHEQNNSSSSSSAKHVKFNPSSSSSSSSSEQSSSSNNNNTNNNNTSTDNNKFTMESIREAKSLRRMQQLEGFENTTSILGQVNQDKLEGEEGDLNEERFQDDSNHLIEHFHLEKERHEGIFNDTNENEKKKKNKNHRVLKKVINEEESFDSSDDEDENDKEKDEWADNLEEMTLYKNNNLNNNSNNDNNTEKEIPSMEECYEFIVNNLNDKKEKISTGLERLKKDNINIYNELIKIINILISYYNQYDIYDKKREYFQKQVKWYYKAKGDETIHGPFKTSEILDWSEYLNDENLDGIKNNLDLKFNLFSSYDFNKFN